VKEKTESKDTSIIPHGIYCYSHTGNTVDIPGWGQVPETKVCPYWSVRDDQPEQENGYCAYLEVGDWEVPWISLLWDQCKECGINDHEENWTKVDGERNEKTR
jgi:hypothetical protein